MAFPGASVTRRDLFTRRHLRVETTPASGLQLSLQGGQITQSVPRQIVELAPSSPELGATKLDTTVEQEPVQKKILDERHIIEACAVDEPEEARNADLSDKGFTHVSRRHASRFSHLKSLDVSGNQLGFNMLNCFPALETLKIRCNGIREVAFGETDFPTLGVQDLLWQLLCCVVFTLRSSHLTWSP